MRCSQVDCSLLMLIMLFCTVTIKEVGGIGVLARTAQQLLDLDCNFDQCKFPKDEEEVLPPDELLRNYWQQREALDHKIDSTLGKIQELLGIKL